MNDEIAAGNGRVLSRFPPTLVRPPSLIPMRRTATLTAPGLARPLTATWLASFRRGLVEWYSIAGRRLPWRTSSTPYAVLVAEVLLQKTDTPKVEQVYDEFMKRWPTVRALADARAKDIRDLIRPLGLKYRATRLKQIAEAILVKHGGVVPREFKDLKSLPGVGAYIASAVRCFAHGEPCAIVDTNVMRVLRRACGFRSRSPRPWEQSSTWRIAQSLLPSEHVREFNWALLDLGALVCTDAYPYCGQCPLRRLCLYHRRTPMRAVRLRTVDHRPIAVDLFAGAGGLSLGFEQAGFRVALAVENDAYSIDTYMANRKTDGLSIIDDDVARVDFRKTLAISKLTPGSIDVLLAGPPCKGYSISNRRTRDAQNPLNKLYLQFLRAAEELRPKWVVFENVAEITSFGGGRVVRRLNKRLKELGYATTTGVLNAAEYGVPQVRRRFFLVGNRVDARFSFPLPTSTGLFGQPVAVRDAIADLPYLGNGNKQDCMSYRVNGQQLSEYQHAMRTGSNGRVHNCSVTLNNDTIRRRYEHIPQGGNWDSIPSSLMRDYENRDMCHTNTYRRLKWNEPAHVLSNIRKSMLVHPSQDRGLSVREAARLQSFPDSYVFSGPLGAQQQQVADAVPPLIAFSLAGRILESVRKT